MFVSVILDSEYMGMGERIKWFLKNISHALENDCLIVTHEYLKTHFIELTQSCSERFYEEFEMRRVSLEEFEKIDVCYIPDSFFDDIYQKSGTRSRMILELSNNRFPELEEYIKKAIEQSLGRRQTSKVEGIFNCLHCFKSIRHIADFYECPIIPYVFSAIRKVHGYQQTLYMANMSSDLLNNDEIVSIYKEFEPNKLGFDLLERKEILALLGKKRNLPLLPVLEKEGLFEMGVVKEAFQILPQSYQNDYATDDDIYYECKRMFKNDDIVTRIHPLQLDQNGLGRKHMKNDPASFILGCKRIATVQSQMLIKAAMWNRVACTISDAIPYSFLVNKNLDSDTTMSLTDLNFILFCYFIPDSCMFDTKYWKWRMEKPTANDIYVKHIYEILCNLGYDESILYDKKNRLANFLSGRRCDKELINALVENRINGEISYRYLSSRLQIMYVGGELEDIYCLNRAKGNLIVSNFKFEVEESIKECRFFPLDDVDGFVEIVAIRLQGNEVNSNMCREEYCPKGKSDFAIELLENSNGKLEISVVWEAKEKEWF